MTTELYMLVYSALLAMAIPTLFLVGRSGIEGGTAWGLGNREGPLTGEPEWIGRATRAHANLLESLPVFAILVLVANAIGLSNDMTALGATLFFYGRIAHLVTYVLGLVPWRTVVFGVALTGEIMILVEILGAG